MARGRMGAVMRRVLSDGAGLATRRLPRCGLDDSVSFPVESMPEGVYDGL
jgi:hypothetical protein